MNGFRIGFAFIALLTLVLVSGVTNIRSDTDTSMSHLMNIYALDTTKYILSTAGENRITGFTRDAYISSSESNINILDFNNKILYSAEAADKITGVHIMNSKFILVLAQNNCSLYNDQLIRKWKLDIPCDIRSVIFSTDNNIYLTVIEGTTHDASSTLYNIDINGIIVWSFKTSAFITDVYANDTGDTYCTTYCGRFICLSNDGHLTNSTNLYEFDISPLLYDYPHEYPIIEFCDKLYVLTLDSLVGLNNDGSLFARINIDKHKYGVPISSKQLVIADNENLIFYTHSFSADNKSEVYIHFVRHDISISVVQINEYPNNTFFLPDGSLAYLSSNNPNLHIVSAEGIKTKPILNDTSLYSKYFILPLQHTDSRYFVLHEFYGKDHLIPDLFSNDPD